MPTINQRALALAFATLFPAVAPHCGAIAVTDWNSARARSCRGSEARTRPRCAPWRSCRPPCTRQAVRPSCKAHPPPPRSPPPTARYWRSSSLRRGAIDVRGASGAGKVARATPRPRASRRRAGRASVLGAARRRQRSPATTSRIRQARGVRAHAAAAAMTWGRRSMADGERLQVRPAAPAALASEAWARDSRGRRGRNRAPPARRADRHRALLGDSLPHLLRRAALRGRPAGRDVRVATRGSTPPRAGRWTTR